MGIGTTLLIWLPILFVLFLVGLFFLLFRNKRKFRIDCPIFSKVSGNIVEGFDKGAVMKTKEGTEYFKLQKRKTTMAVPDKRFWILNERGGISIKFYRYGLEDYAPLDLKFDLGNVHFSPINTDAKQHHALKARELAIKHSKKDFKELLVRSAIFALLIIGFIVLVIFYFNAASSLTGQALASGQSLISKSTVVLDKANQLVEALANAGLLDVQLQQQANNIPVGIKPPV